MKKQYWRIIAIGLALLLGLALTATSQDAKFILVVDENGDTISALAKPPIGMTIGYNYILPNTQIQPSCEVNLDSLYLVIDELESLLQASYTLLSKQIWKLDSIRKMNEAIYNKLINKPDTITSTILFNGTFELIGD